MLLIVFGMIKSDGQSFGWYVGVVLSLYHILMRNLMGEKHGTIDTLVGKPQYELKIEIDSIKTWQRK